MKKTRRRLPSIRWRDGEPMKGGSPQEYSADGLFRLQCIDQYEGIPMARRYVLYQFRAGEWVRVWEGYSRNVAEKTARQRLAILENDDE
jgi:hypothetical protein